MGKKLSEVANLPVPSTPQGEPVREAGIAFKAAYMATVALEESDDAVAALEEYSNKVDRISENRNENDRMLDFAISTNEHLIELCEALLKDQPHAILDCNSESARAAERWCDDNCVGDVNYFEVSNACVITFTEHGDCILFKVKFGV